MPLPKLTFTEQRMDVISGEPCEVGGYLMQKLMAVCPNCGKENMLAYWEDGDGRGVGSLTCDNPRCKKMLITEDAPVAKKAVKPA